jgi:hypothetical protein
VHDIVDLEAAGLPGVFVASTQFVDAAESQSRALGVTPAVVFVPHPIQNRTDSELWSMADDVLDALTSALLSSGDTGSPST